MNNRVNILVVAVVGILSVSLIVSVLFNVYYENLRVENENVLSTIRARALWTYGSEVGRLADHFDEYLVTHNYTLYEEIITMTHTVRVEADVFMQGLGEESASMYYELRATAGKLYNYFLTTLVMGGLNYTEIGLIAQELHHIGDIINSADFDVNINKDPIAVLSQSDINNIINNCQQIQEMLPPWIAPS